MRGKKGQAYLIAALIVISLLSAFIGVSNYAKKKAYSEIEVISNQLDLESEKVLDYNLINGEDELDNFTEEFSNYAGEDIQIYYITGKRSGPPKVYTYPSENIDSNFNSGSNTLNITVDSIVYSFYITEGFNFHYVMVEKKKGEKYVITK